MIVHLPDNLLLVLSAKSLPPQAFVVSGGAVEKT